MGMGRFYIKVTSEMGSQVPGSAAHAHGHGELISNPLGNKSSICPGLFLLPMYGGSAITKESIRKV